MPNYHPNTKGLKPFKPGAEWTGNASGRPKKRPITDEYYQVLSEPIPEVIRKRVNRRFRAELLPKGSTWARATAIGQAMESIMPGGHPAAKEMREAIEGKAPMRLEIQGVERKETTLRVIFEKRTANNHIELSE